MSDNVYLVTGDDLLVDEVLERIRSETGTDSLSEVSFDADAAADDVLTALGTASLLGGPRLVVLRDAHSLKKDQADSIARYLEAPSSEAVLVLVASGRTKLDAVVRKVGTVVQLDAPKGRRLVAWLRERARGLGMAIDERGAWALIDAVGGELRDLDTALEQIISAGEMKVGAAQVKRLFPRAADERIYAFTDAIGDRRLPVAMATLRRLLDQGDEPLLIFGAMTAHVRRMLRARRAADRGPRYVAEELGLPTWRAERLARQARSFTEEDLVRALSILAATDLDIKSGEALPEAALERAVVEIVAAEPA